MFVGEYRHGVDAKGRIILPSKFREELMGGAYLTKGLDRCLWLVPKGNWQRMLETLSRQDTNQPGPRAFIRAFYSGTHELAPDRQGRLVVPPPLREWAGLDKEVVITGYNDRIEVWDATAWDRYLAEAEERYDDNAQLLIGGGGI